jgi:uncharacterized protein (UPF0335 family)
MGRPRGSRNKVKIEGLDIGNGSEVLRNTVSAKELRDYIERIEYCNEQQKEISSDRSQIFKECKQAGYDRKTIRAIVARRKLTAQQRETADALMEEYMSALGDFAGTPLGEAMRPDARAAAE